MTNSINSFHFLDLPIDISTYAGSFFDTDTLLPFRTASQACLTLSNKIIKNNLIELVVRVPKSVMDVPLAMRKITNCKEDSDLNSLKTAIRAHSDPLLLFKKLTTWAVKNGAVSGFDCFNITAFEFNNQLQDHAEALCAIWSRLSDMPLKTAVEIRAWFDNPKNDFIINQTNRVHLMNLDLKILPPQIGRLIGLEELVFSENQISILPAALTNLTELKSISCSKNQIKSIPEWIGNLTQLNILICDDNKITHLPKRIGDLSNLYALHCNKNKITALPNELCKLTEFYEDLDLSENQLTALPVEFGNLIQVANLFLSNNCLTALPITFANLQDLNDLDLASNRLDRFPPEICSLTLHTLDLSNNQISELPNEIVKLTTLKDFDLSNNQIWTFPEGFVNLYIQLDRFRINGNSLIAISDELLSKDQNADNLFINYKKALQHSSQSAMAKLYQAILRGKNENEISSFFLELPEGEIKSLFLALSEDEQYSIFEMICHYSKSSETFNLQWAKDHVFDNKNIFYLSVRKAICSKFQKLSQEDQKLLYENYNERSSSENEAPLDKWKQEKESLFQEWNQLDNEQSSSGNEELFDEWKQSVVDNLPLLADLMSDLETVSPRPLKKQKNEN